MLYVSGIVCGEQLVVSHKKFKAYYNGANAKS